MEISTSKTETVAKRDKRKNVEVNGIMYSTVCLQNLLHSPIIRYVAFSCFYLVAQNINLLGKLMYKPAQFQHYIYSFPYLPVLYERFCIPEKCVLTGQIVYMKHSYSKSSDKCIDSIIQRNVRVFGNILEAFLIS